MDKKVSHSCVDRNPEEIDSRLANALENDDIFTI